jgi:uncharacterized membrane protein YphA (DoxX/SURF4 family)
MNTRRKTSWRLVPQRFPTGSKQKAFRKARWYWPAGFLFVLIFLIAGPNHFAKQTIAYAASQGVPLASLAVPLSGILALAGGLSVLLGYRARVGAWLIALFLVLVTFMMHKFWIVHDCQNGSCF